MNDAREVAEQEVRLLAQQLNAAVDRAEALGLEVMLSVSENGSRVQRVHPVISATEEEP